jgi:hypothetical protein
VFLSLKTRVFFVFLRVFKRVFYLHRESTEESTEGALAVDEREIENMFLRPTL